MKRIVIRPRIQIPLLVVGFAVFGLIGVGLLTDGDVIAKRDWFGIVLGAVLIPGAAVGIWRAVRLGVVMDTDGIRVRGLDHRDRVTWWSEVREIECAQVDTRAGLPIYVRSSTSVTMTCWPSPCSARTRGPTRSDG
jgi:hypothetical protein